MKRRATYLKEAQQIITKIGLPSGQQNERSALCLLALVDVRPGNEWAEASSPFIGITPMMEWISQYHLKKYKPNTRETVRRQTVHQFCEAGIVISNPDDPLRPINSPKTVYQIEPTALELIRSFGTVDWKPRLIKFHEEHEALVTRFAMHREQNLIPVKTELGQQISLSPGPHSELMRDIIESFAPRYAPGSELVYAGDTKAKWGYFNADLLNELKVEVDAHGKMPDVILYLREKNWLLLIESVTSHGPVDAKRHMELRKLFSSSTAGIVYVTAFPERGLMSQYITEIAWETEVWVSSDPTHLIHFNGERFLGPY